MNIHELVLPADADDTHWQHYIELGNVQNREILGTTEWDEDPGASLRGAQSTTTFRVRRFLAYDDDTPIGYAVMRINLRDDPDAADLMLYTHPDHRRRGVGAALADALTGALHPRLTRLEVWITTPLVSEGVLPSPTGAGGVQSDHPGVKMALRYGFRLGLVERISRFDLQTPAATLEAHLRPAREAAGNDYRLIALEGPVPEEHLAGFARLKERMASDIPIGELTAVAEQWDEQRVQDYDADISSTMRPFRTVVVHEPTGQLVGVSELMVNATAPDHVVDQWDTVVLGEHRGRRLGMWMKAANILAVKAAVPQAPAIITWNAEENRHMLDVNEALGFVTIGVEGAFERKLN